MLELAGAMLKAGEGSGACSGIQASDPTPDTGMQRGITRACVVPPLKILVEVTRSRSARSHALGSVTALLVPTPLGQEIQQHHLHQVMQRMACP